MKKQFFVILFAMLCYGGMGQAGNWLWAKSAGEAEGYGVASDNLGNIYALGMYGPTIIFGTTTLTSIGSVDLFLTKYDAAGNVIWARSAGGSDYEQGNAVTIDNSGNIYITGFFASNTITFGSYTLTKLISGTSTWDVFIVKYDPSGNVLWAKSGGGNYYNSGNSIVTDNSGIYVTGYFYSSTITFGSTTLTQTAGSATHAIDMFLVKYDLSGTLIWARSGGGISDDVANSVSLDLLGNVFVGGTFSSTTASFGSVSLTNADIYEMENAYILKYDSNGNTLWGNGFGDASGAFIGLYGVEGNSVATDATGIYFVGQFDCPLTLGAYTLANSTGAINLFVIKYDEAGNVLWAKGEGYSNDKANIVATDATGIYVAGKFGSPSITLGTTTYISPSLTGDPMFLIKYDTIGNILCSAILSSGGDDIAPISTDHLGNLYVSGDFLGNSLVIGSDTLLATDTLGETFFIAKYNCNGEPVGIKKQSYKETISICPNPFSSQTTITFSEEQKHTIVSITDVLGKEVYHTLMSNGTKTLTMEKGTMQPGIYFVKATDQHNKVSNLKVMVQ